MREYVSHKKVMAAEIVAVNPDGSLGLDDGNTFPKLEHIKYEPKLGDYLVRYEDGYHSISPKAAFENGYTGLFNHNTC